MKKKRKTRSGRRRARTDSRFLFRDIITANAYGSLRDESYSLIHRCVEETLKDPELREKIDYYARQILKAIAAKL